MSSLQSHAGSIQFDMGIEQEHAQSQEESRNATNSYQSNLSYRQNRRVQQLLRANGKKRRGPTRAIKWKNERKHRLGQKPTLKITQGMKRVIGENADQFITEVGLWVRNMLPLESRGWKHIESGIKDRLFNKIKAEWNLPEEANVDQVIEHQCMVLYRQWRYRLKEKFFDGFSIAGALKNCPEDVDPDQWKWVVEKYWGSNRFKHISEVYSANRAKQTLKASQGNISTARILEQLRTNCHATTSTSRASEQASESMQEGFEASAETNGGVSEMSSSPPSEPEYIKLWMMTKRHKDKSMDEFALKKLNEFKELHQEQLELHGEDNLTVQEAYIKVLGTCSGYIKGLGFGPKPPKCIKEGSIAENAHLAHQIAEVEKASREREAVLEERIQKLQEREEKMLGEIESLRKEAQERENRNQEREERLKEEFRAMMQEKLSSITHVQSRLI